MFSHHSLGCVRRECIFRSPVLPKALQGSVANISISQEAQAGRVICKKIQLSGGFLNPSVTNFSVYISFHPEALVLLPNKYTAPYLQDRGRLKELFSDY